MAGRMRRAVLAAVLTLAASPGAAAEGLTEWTSLTVLGGEVAVTAMTALIRQGVIEAAAEAPRPLTPSMRAGMAHGIPVSLLDRARWTLPPAAPSLLATLFRSEDVDAVTLGDVIVFRDMAAAGDPALLAHEMAHVAQYAILGLDGFARRYALQASDMELEARLDVRRWFGTLPSEQRPTIRPVR